MIEEIINGKKYKLTFKVDNSAPCGNCAFHDKYTHDIEKMCKHPDKKNRKCKHEPGSTRGWNTTEYMKI